MFRNVACSIALALCMTLAASSAWAAGAYLYELGTPDLGTAAAGRAALGQDASTVLGNPAGMTRLERSQFTGSLYTILPSVQFDRSSGTTAVGGMTSMPARRFPLQAWSVSLYRRAVSPTSTVRPRT